VNPLLEAHLSLRRRMLKLLVANALQHKRAGRSAIEWMLLWYQPDCFPADGMRFPDEMNIAMAQTAGWVWGECESA
jgi:hypothetical protein